MTNRPCNNLCPQSGLSFRHPQRPLNQAFFHLEKVVSWIVQGDQPLDILVKVEKEGLSSGPIMTILEALACREDDRLELHGRVQYSRQVRETVRLAIYDRYPNGTESIADQEFGDVYWYGSSPLPEELQALRLLLRLGVSDYGVLVNDVMRLLRLLPLAITRDRVRTHDYETGSITLSEILLVCAA